MSEAGGAIKHRLQEPGRGAQSLVYPVLGSPPATCPSSPGKGADHPGSPRHAAGPARAADPWVLAP